MVGMSVGCPCVNGHDICGVCDTCWDVQVRRVEQKMGDLLDRVKLQQSELEVRRHDTCYSQRLKIFCGTISRFTSTDSMLSGPKVEAGLML